ncbi:ABC transporter permease [Desulfobaculum bizertense]|uniref:Transport permease protein n=1 Tax=Desulfobaculum bizertense DSM 18034 TaxID=1121442 RepID=A0A1T4VZ76_9BACT|nr:ABC transporter permease [Desulfobaculum bizertense]SKA70199.1 capsular polysaccharide transport system permease protein [Desulfobaculum bizertense DSM 18034]
MKKRTSLDIVKSVVFALIIRELKTRFGFHKFGYIWAIIEPAAFVAVFWVIFEFHMRKTLPGIDYPMFVLTGVVPWLMLKQIVFRSLGAFQSNIGLFQYRQVKPIDTLVARSIIELILSSIVFLLYIAVGASLGFNVSIHNLIGLTGAITTFFLFSFSLGLVCATIGVFSENFKKSIKLIFRPLYFISGIFFSAHIIPKTYTEIMLLNPILHFMELIRSCYFSAYTKPQYSITYIFSLTLLLTLVSLAVYKRLEKRLVQP